MSTIKFPRNNNLPITKSLRPKPASSLQPEAPVVELHVESLLQEDAIPPSPLPVAPAVTESRPDTPVTATLEAKPISPAVQTVVPAETAPVVAQAEPVKNDAPKEEAGSPNPVEKPVLGQVKTDLAGGLTYKLDIGMDEPPPGGFRAEQMREILEKMGVSPARVHFALEREKLTKEHLSQVMRDFNFLSAENVARALAIQANLEFFPADSVDYISINDEGLKKLQDEMPVYQGFAPVFFDLAQKRLVLAVADAQNISTAANRFYQYKTTIVIASESTIQLIFRKFFSSTEAAFDRELKKYQDINDSKTVDLDQSPGLLRDLFGALLRHACTQKVSDIHMHMTEHVGLIKLTMDGVSTIFRSIPADLYSRILTRLISDAKVKIEDLRNGMKEGSVEWNAADAALFSDVFSRYGFRLQLGEAKGGFTAVIRILDRNANASELSHLDFDDWTSSQLRRIVGTSAGLMLITGPTGSGKTTTLYAILKEIDPVTRSIQTIEHPVEYRHGLWMQYEISRTAKSEGDEWGKMLKGLLRNAPKVILMGEVRDAETARTLIEAANTGHLVFTTLHTNTAAMAIARLKKLAVDMDSLAGELLGVLAQRLVRVLCSHCKVEDNDPETLEELNNPKNQEFLQQFAPYTPFKASVRGCPHCNFTGYRGRKIVYELLTMNLGVRSAIEKNAPTSEIAKAGIKHGFSMWDCGLKIVARGLTGLSDLRSVVHKDVSLDD